MLIEGLVLPLKLFELVLELLLIVSHLVCPLIIAIGSLKGCCADFIITNINQRATVV